MLWNRVSQPDAVHVTCFCLYYSQRSPAFPLGLFFPSTSSCFCSSCSSCVFVCGFFFVCTRCLLSLTDDERKDTVSLQSWPLICLPPLLLNQSLQRHTKRCHGFLLLLSLSFFYISPKLIGIFSCSFTRCLVLYLQPFLTFCFTPLLILPASGFAISSSLQSSEEPFVGWGFRLCCSIRDIKTNEIKWRQRRRGRGGGLLAAASKYATLQLLRLWAIIVCILKHSIILRQMNRKILRLEALQSSLLITGSWREGVVETPSLLSLAINWKTFIHLNLLLKVGRSDYLHDLLILLRRRINETRNFLPPWCEKRGERM